MVLTNFKELVQHLKTYRYLFNQVVEGGQTFLRDLDKQEQMFTVHYPCDVIDLRQILTTMQIESNSEQVICFGLGFSEKYLKRYPVWIQMDSRKMPTIADKFCNAVFVYKNNKIDIKDAACRITINQPVDKSVLDAILKIINESDCGLEYYMSNSIPALSGFNPRLSKTKKNMKQKKYATVDLPVVSLDAKEQQIFNFLVQVKKYFNLNTEFRVAGGWVRDRLLGLPSDDIDIALSNMTGSQLTDYIKKYPHSNGVVGQDYSVAENVDKSKHLETAGIDLFGQKVEFVNLRSEVYTNSRIPEMKMGTPETDAQRRDLTINSLFYNVETGKVEDYVGGLEDLKNKVIKTPLDPVQTFSDDPLRVLRALRFLSRFSDFKIDPKMVEAMKLPEVQESYVQKVSTERAGPEIMKMMKGNNPVEPIKILFETDLYKSVFKVPEMGDIHQEGIMMNQKTPWHKLNLMNHTLEVVKNMNEIMKQKGEKDDMRGLMNLAAVFHDFGKMKNDIPTPHPKNPEQMQYINHEKASARMADAIMKSIGVGKDERDIVNQVVLLHMEPHQSDKWGPNGKGSFLRKTRMHGKEEEHKDLWKYIFWHAQADEMAGHTTSDAVLNEDKFNNYKNYVESPNGQFRGTLLTGNDIMSLIPSVDKKTGYIKDVLSRLQELQDNGVIDVGFSRMPEGIEKEQAKRQSRQIAIDQVLKMKPQIETQYQQIDPAVQFKRVKPANNWYALTKQADQVFSVPKTEEDKKGIVKGPKPAKFPFEVGMRVRDRRKGIALTQEYGIVKHIRDEKMEIEWHLKSGEKQKKSYAIGDTATITYLIAEV